MDIEKYKNGGVVLTKKEVEQQKIIEKLSIACLSMDNLMKTCLPTRSKNPVIGSPNYSLKEAIKEIRK